MTNGSRHSLDVEVRVVGSTAALLDVLTLMARRAVVIERVTAELAQGGERTIRSQVTVPSGRKENLIGRLEALPRVVSVRSSER